MQVIVPTDTQVLRAFGLPEGSVLEGIDEALRLHGSTHTALGREFLCQVSHAWRELLSLLHSK